ncbi:MAG: hypothetical protein M1831_003108 [Alyxoria varia]|nr:MAG: hypothetical protein M1831_003108 [Alyxoria varia]
MVPGRLSRLPNEPIPEIRIPSFQKTFQFKGKEYTPVLSKPVNRTLPSIQEEGEEDEITDERTIQPRALDIYEGPDPPWAAIQDQPKEFAQNWLDYRVHVHKDRRFYFYQGVAGYNPTGKIDAARLFKFVQQENPRLPDMSDVQGDLANSLPQVNVHYILSPYLLYNLFRIMPSANPPMSPEEFNEEWDQFMQDAGDEMRSVINDAALNAFEGDSRLGDLMDRALIMGHSEPTREEPIGSDTTSDWSFITRGEALAVHQLALHFSPKVGVILNEFVPVLGVIGHLVIQETYQRAINGLAAALIKDQTRFAEPRPGKYELFPLGDTTQDD